MVVLVSGSLQHWESEPEQFVDQQGQRIMFSNLLRHFVNGPNESQFSKEPIAPHRETTAATRLTARSLASCKMGLCAGLWLLQMPQSQ
jgi:hypothetical protein